MDTPHIRTLLAGACLLFGGSAVADVDSKRADLRQHNQAKRIHTGWAYGSLTRRETTTLIAQQSHIQRAERRYEADGRLSIRERARLETKQDRASANIHRKKHNQRTRY